MHAYPPAMSTTEETNPYELLNVGLEATDKDIKSAYRKLSLKVHPDRVSLFSSCFNYPAKTSSSIRMIPKQVGRIYLSNIENRFDSLTLAILA